MQINMEDIISGRKHVSDFEWTSRRFVPSNYFVRGKPKDPVELIKLVLASDQLWYSMIKASKETNTPEKEIYKIAEKILIELGHDFHMYSVRWFGLTLSKLSKTLYRGIQVHTKMIPEIRQAYMRCPVILLPTHRSYVDFLLISFVSFNYDLALPIIAAGMDFMSMVGVGEMLRKSGAFYIRRTFGQDLLYWSIVSEYIRKAMVMGGHPLEMFIEGTRSRSGKALRPKVGLLSAVLELVRSSEVPDILILPVALSYDRTLEDSLYAHELLGMPKLRESTQGLFKALVWLRSQEYGAVYVNFGRPMSFRSILEKEHEKICSRSSSSDQDAFVRAVKTAAESTVLAHQHCLRVPMFAGISLVILSNMSRGNWQTSLPKLIKAVSNLRVLLRSVESDFGFPLPGHPMEANIRYLVQVHATILKDEQDLISVNHCNNEPIVFMKLQHYANQILPKLLPFCIISLLLKLENWEIQDAQSINKNKNFEENYSFVRQYFKAEFLYSSETEVRELNSALSTLLYLNDTESSPDDVGHICTILRHGLEPYLLSYWAIMKVILLLSSSNRNGEVELTSRPASPASPGQLVDTKTLGQLAQNILLQEMKTCFPKHFGALSLDAMGSACICLIGFGAAQKTKLEYGMLGVVVADEQILANLTSQVEKLISSSIDKPHWNSVYIPLIPAKL